MSKMVQARINALEIENAELRRQLEERPSLRDQFAMAALTGFITPSATYFDSQSFNLIANYSYEIAEAMMGAREVRY